MNTKWLNITPLMVILMIIILCVLIINTILLYKAHHKFLGSLMILGLLITMFPISGTITNNWSQYFMQSDMQQELNQKHSKMNKLAKSKYTNDYLRHHNHYRIYFDGTQEVDNNHQFSSVTKINNKYGDVTLIKSNHHYQIKSIDIDTKY